MSTTIVETWATDIAQLGAIYPFAGSEMLLVLLAFAAWIGWHIWQMAAEKREEAETLRLIREQGGYSATPPETE